ncbi:MAG TPA: hypothetical protein VF980_19520, partial [Thermoanaerobaculia bacterium]
MTGKFGIALLCALLFAASVHADELAITSGGRRIIDRDPSSAASNCAGWTYGPSPVTDDAGNIIAMYTVSDALAHHCDVGVLSEERFGDSIQRHVPNGDGTWSAGRNVVDRTSFAWMSDAAFLQAHPETFVGHVASPSVVRIGGRYYMAFVGSVNDPNLCAAEHDARNGCGSCSDPWSYFVIMWAVSDDGVNWRVRERAPGDGALLARLPAAGDKHPGSIFKGLTRARMIEYAEGGKSYFYIAAEYWGAGGIKILMFRVAHDAASDWGITGTPQVWSASKSSWLDCPDGQLPGLFDDFREPSLADGGISGIARTNILGYDTYIAVTASNTSMGSSSSNVANSIMYYTSADLVHWMIGRTIRSAIPDFADGFGYSVSVIDPTIVNERDGTLKLYLASADGDIDHGIDRDGHYDCYLDPTIPTAPYVGTGIYEATVRNVVLQPTTITIVPPSGPVIS